MEFIIHAYIQLIHYPLFFQVSVIYYGKDLSIEDSRAFLLEIS